MYQRLRDLREDRDLTQQELATLLKVTQATYSRYESGALDIPSTSLIKLAEFYKTSIDYLLGLTNNKKPYR
ncbi:MAG: helix-turn-helix transcriptional regulator [Desulfitobacterium hafniense]|nr:helix-turn-helix transcriptional regulator [Desulfitobacterium hafniense]